MSALARRTLTGTLVAVLGISSVFHIAIAADVQSGASAQNEIAAPAQRAKGPLEILLSQHPQRTRSAVPAQSAANAGLPAVATPPLDVQPNAPSGSANDVRKNGVATTSASPGTAPVSVQATPLRRELPAVPELAPPASSDGEGN